MRRIRHSVEPTLFEAWTMLGDQMGLTVEDRGNRSVRASGEVRGRTLDIEIDGKGARSEFARFFFDINTISSRNRREKWHTAVTIGCANPRGLTGVIDSSVDTNDPAWQPGRYDPRAGRSVVTDPPSLADHVLTPDTHERLMSIRDHIRISVGPDTVGIDQRDTALPSKGATYVAGSFLHHFLGPIPPWPERAIAGPPWWIDLLCDIADTVDR